MGHMQKASRRIGLAIIATLVAIDIVPMAASAGSVPTWDDQINNPNRFDVLAEFGWKAVLDRETGLVWEQAPATANVVWTAPFLGAVDTCYNKGVGGRAGWRLPTVEELNSLRDLAQTNPALPPGHPFINISDTYWSITTDPSLPNRAYTVRFSATLGGSTGVSGKGNQHRAWCVRGGHGHDGM
jgi:hypothetical protein